MNHTDPELGGDWPVVPTDPAPPGCSSSAWLISAICVAVLVIATAMAMFAWRGGP